MPFINGRYHMNPAMGQALEDARSAAEELLASEDASHSLPDDDSTDRSESADAKGPIHHVEIDAAEGVPSQTGRATHGFVARVHRKVSVGAQHAVPGADTRLDAAHPAPLRPETHVFTNHRDLLDFLRAELAHDCSGA